MLNFSTLFMNILNDVYHTVNTVDFFLLLPASVLWRCSRVFLSALDGSPSWPLSFQPHTYRSPPSADETVWVIAPPPFADSAQPLRCQHLASCESHLPLMQTECHPPAATQLMGIPQRASTTRGSSSEVRPPWPSWPWLWGETSTGGKCEHTAEIWRRQRRVCSIYLPSPQVYTTPEALSSKACSPLSATLLAFRCGDRGW